MRRKRDKSGPTFIVFREPTRAELLAEWRRRRERCHADLAEAKAAGNFVAYRGLKKRWDRFYTKDYARDERDPPPAAFASAKSA